MKSRLLSLITLLALPLSLNPAHAESIDLTKSPAPPIPNTLGMGGKNPAGDEINVNTQYLTLNGKPWTPVMGEFHYARVPRADWDEEMQKMKAGGVTVLSTYVIWIFHEETKGAYDWSGNKDLHAFIDACAKNGLKVVLRIGPWVHSEARNGGIPDWVVDQAGVKNVRTTDPKFLALTKDFYDETFKQVKGQFWKDGGPIIAVQIDNESKDTPYLQSMKKIAVASGFDAPLYTITAWDHVRPPESGLLPMFGGYAEGFWQDDKRMNPKARTHYFFTPIRDDSEIDLKTLHPTAKSIDLSYINKYPFLTCEIGGGMAISYARRPLLNWQDITASALTQFGAGSNLLGYYMYQGGSDPLGKNQQGLQEKQDSPSTNFNDLPPIHYDFQAPLGQYGQVRPVYHSLAILHDFINDFGEQLATMPPVFPQEMPKSIDDYQTLRWVVRTNGKSGFIFINNYERAKTLPARPLQLNLKLFTGNLSIPASRPAQFPADTFAILPFNLDLNGALLQSATAQLICRLDDAATPTYVFFTPGNMHAEFTFDTSTLYTSGGVSTTFNSTITPTPGDLFTVLAKDGGRSKILLLTQEQAMHLYKANIAGSPRLLMSPADLAFNNENITVTSRDPKDMSISVYPAPTNGFTLNGAALPATPDGIFTKYAASAPEKQISLDIKKTKDAAPARPIVLGPTRKPQVPTEPNDPDFNAAAVWQVTVPSDALSGLHEVYLKIDYAADAARAFLGDQFIDDDFYFGQPWEIGIKRFSPDISQKGLTLKVLPLRKDSPVNIDPTKIPPFNAQGEALDLHSLTAIPEYQLTIQPTATQK